MEVLSLGVCGANTHLYAQTAGLPLLVNSTLSAGATEHIGAHFALALHLLEERKHADGTVGTPPGFYRFHTHGGAVPLLTGPFESAVSVD